jgi:hypothetical protein
MGRRYDEALLSVGRLPLWPHRLMTLYVWLDPSAKGTRMHFGHAQYLPMAPSLFALLAVALGILLILVQIRVLRYAYMQLGVSSGAAFCGRSVSDRRLEGRSRMRREPHVRFGEGGGVKFPSATRPIPRNLFADVLRMLAELRSPPVSSTA